MTLIIICKKITGPSRSVFAYQAKGDGFLHEDFYNWLTVRHTALNWRCWEWHCWEFKSSVDDVAIRLEWSDYLVHIDDEHSRREGQYDVQDQRQKND